MGRTCSECGNPVVINQARMLDITDKNYYVCTPCFRKPRPYVCSSCGNVFTDQYKLVLPKCPACGKKSKGQAIAEPLPQAVPAASDRGKGGTSSTRWYYKGWFIVPMLVFFAPVGLILLWKGSSWGKTPKIIMTVIAVTLFGLALGVQKKQQAQEEAAPSQGSNVQAEGGTDSVPPARAPQSDFGSPAYTERCRKSKPWFPPSGQDLLIGAKKAACETLVKCEEDGKVPAGTIEAEGCEWSMTKSRGEDRAMDIYFIQPADFRGAECDKDCFNECVLHECPCGRNFSISVARRCLVSAKCGFHSN